MDCSLQLPTKKNILLYYYNYTSEFVSMSTNLKSDGRISKLTIECRVVTDVDLCTIYDLNGLKIERCNGFLRKSISSWK